MALIESNIDLKNKKIFVFHEKMVLVDEYDQIPFSDEGLSLIATECVLEDGSMSAVAMLASSEASFPTKYHFMPIREYFFTHTTGEAALLSRMLSYAKWRSETSYCSKCGASLSLSPSENALVCDGCNKIHFPRIEPCVIVLVSKGDEILLLRHKNRIQDIFACLSGFIEVGETAEQAVCREVMEESGLKVKNVKYMGSQGWPFPDQLMLAFTAEYESGEIKIQEEEIAEAHWFRRDNLPKIPQRGSIAWRLINMDF